MTDPAGTKRKPKVNNSRRAQKSTDAVIEVRRHLRLCRICHAAHRSMSPHDMCANGLMLTMNAAFLLEYAIKLRISADRDRDGLIYPCPNPALHGSTWAHTVLPVMATGIQDRLF